MSQTLHQNYDKALTSGNQISIEIDLTSMRNIGRA